ncbi:MULTISPECIES: endolytic transglycosylase MltG [unclassified Cetobacterium]|uniref:endolytic transglycosylase MltG n=1 Tax=unclassified Cetobacterium TaxID=2630983 RepID=UPI000648EFE4|nr:MULTISPECIES: endolytic transglycosylase MltG [unclassified Cetobacterium]
MKKKFLIFLLIILTGVFSIFKLYSIKVDAKKEYKVQVNLRTGTSLNSAFKQMGIADSIFFKIFLKYEKNSGKNIKAGFYELDGKYSYRDIIQMMEEGRVKYTILTIPEGYSIKEIGSLLKERGIGTEEGLRNALKEIKDFPYLTPDGNFEGYLYPETYYLAVDTNEKEVAKAMLGQFLKIFPPDKYSDKKEFYEKLIMASIIEREAQLKDEKPLMSSVFYNRLKKGMKLGSDATVNYLYDYSKRRMYYKDLKIDSPYNTYMYRGLPPGPISNPDYSSVMAAMNPAETDYLFFVVTSTGKHTFTKTYREHLEVQKKK